VKFSFGGAPRRPGGVKLCSRNKWRRSRFVGIPTGWPLPASNEDLAGRSWEPSTERRPHRAAGRIVPRVRRARFVTGTGSRKHPSGAGPYKFRGVSPGVELTWRAYHRLLCGKDGPPSKRWPLKGDPRPRATRARPPLKRRRSVDRATQHHPGRWAEEAQADGARAHDQRPTYMARSHSSWLVPVEKWDRKYSVA